MIRAGDLRDRITLQRLDDDTGAFANFPTATTVWADVQALGDGRYRIRIRDRSDLRAKADLAPAVRVLYGGQALAVEDVIEVERRVETHLIAARVIVETPQLQTGVHRIEAWPA